MYLVERVAKRERVKNERLQPKEGEGRNKNNQESYLSNLGSSNYIYALDNESSARQGTNTEN